MSGTIVRTDMSVDIDQLQRHPLPQLNCYWRLMWLIR